jgi:hypothetical protein
METEVSNFGARSSVCCTRRTNRCCFIAHAIAECNLSYVKMWNSSRFVSLYDWHHPPPVYIGLWS